MAASSGLKIIHPWRLWCVVTVLTGLLFGGAALSIRATAAKENERIAQLQLDTLIRARLQELDQGNLRSISDGLGAEASSLFINVKDGDSQFEIGTKTADMSCATIDQKMAIPNADRRGRVIMVTLCRPFVSPITMLLLVGGIFLLVATTSMILIFRLEKSATQALMKLFASHGVEASRADGLPGLLAKVNELNDAVQEARRIEVDSERSRALLEMAEQVAHDIRSPLAAIKAVMSDALPQLSERARSIMLGASERLTSIANQLLADKKNGSVAAKPDFLAIVPLVESVILEKLAEYSEQTLVKIKHIGLDGNPSAFAVEHELKSVLSNLLNNSFEALLRANSDGSVVVTTAISGIFVTIEVADNGPGIPEGLLANLGSKRGVKGMNPDGNGLGLFHAFKTIEASGGSLLIKPNEKAGHGTVITISLPVAEAPRKPNCSHGTCILVDDDIFIRESWRKICQENGVNITTFSDGNSLKLELAKIPKETLFFLDSVLSDHEKGEDLALELYQFGYRSIYMATGYDADRFSSNQIIKGVVGKEPPTWLLAAKFDRVDK